MLFAPIHQGGDNWKLYKPEEDSDKAREVYHYKVGHIAKLDAGKVDENMNNTCSRGLHAGAWSYVSDFGSSDTQAIMLVVVDPEHIAAIPSDYDYQKIRVSQFYITGLLNKFTKNLYNSSTYGAITDKEFKEKLKQTVENKDEWEEE